MRLLAGTQPIVTEFLWISSSLQTNAEKYLDEASAAFSRILPILLLITPIILRYTVRDKYNASGKTTNNK